MVQNPPHPKETWSVYLTQVYLPRNKITSLCRSHWIINTTHFHATSKASNRIIIATMGRENIPRKLLIWKEVPTLQLRKKSEVPPSYQITLIFTNKMDYTKKKSFMVYPCILHNPFSFVFPNVGYLIRLTLQTIQTRSHLKEGLASLLSILLQNSGSSINDLTPVKGGKGEKEGERKERMGCTGVLGRKVCSTKHRRMRTWECSGSLTLEYRMEKAAWLGNVPA